MASRAVRCPTGDCRTHLSLVPDDDRFRSRNSAGFSRRACLGGPSDHAGEGIPAINQRTAVTHVSIEERGHAASPRWFDSVLMGGLIAVSAGGKKGIMTGMTPIFRSSVDGSPDRQLGWRKDEHHDDSSKEVP